MNYTGEKPGKGYYYCTMCRERVIINNSKDMLPPCPKCTNSKYTK